MGSPQKRSDSNIDTNCAKVPRMGGFRKSFSRTVKYWWRVIVRAWTDTFKDSPLNNVFKVALFLVPLAAIFLVSFALKQATPIYTWVGVAAYAGVIIVVLIWKLASIPAKLAAETEQRNLEAVANIQAEVESLRSRIAVLNTQAALANARVLLLENFLPKATPVPQKLVSLREAGIQLFNGASAERKDFAQTTARINGPDEPIMDYFERMIIVAAKEGLTQLHGRRAPEVTLELLSLDDLNGQSYKGSGNVGSNSYSRDPDWYDLHIPDSEIAKVQDLIGDEARRNAAFHKYY